MRLRKWLVDGLWLSAKELAAKWGMSTDGARFKAYRERHPSQWITGSD